jgi:hypothetical protein
MSLSSESPGERGVAIHTEALSSWGSRIAGKLRGAGESKERAQHQESEID